MQLKFADFIVENSKKPFSKRVIVVYGGGFQPFHAGHLSGYLQAKKAFPKAHFFVASSNDIKARPIPFKDKKFLAQQAGVVDDFVQVKSPLNPTEILEKYNPEQDILILVRSERDPMKYTKKDGLPAFYQPFVSLDNCDTFAKHAYVFVTKKHDFSIAGTVIYSGSQVRAMYSSSNDEKKKTIIKDLYPHSTQPKKVKQLLDKYIPSQLSEEYLIEGINDKAIFKAVFLAGGPGSGKDYILKNTLEGHGMVEINSDNAFEYLLDKYNLDKKMPESEEQQRDAIRAKAKSSTELKERLALHGRNGLIINGTGDDPSKIAKIKARLEGLGYDTKLLLVNTKDEVSKKRNIERGERGGRTVPEKIRFEKWDAVQKARDDLKDIFGPEHYHEIDNSHDLRPDSSGYAGDEIKQQKEAEMLDLFKNFRKFTETPPESEEANQWINTQKQMTKSLAANPRQETDPNQEPAAAPQTQTGQPAPAQQTAPAAPQSQGQSNSSNQLLPMNVKKLQSTFNKSPLNVQSAIEKARKMGLEYYGFGRFGKGGHTTHKEVNGDLRELDPLHEQFKEAMTPQEIASKHGVKLIEIIKQLKMGVKVEKEHTTSDEMARKIALQHLAEIPNYYTRLKKVESKKKINESFLSGSDAMQLLTLGRDIDIFDYSTNLNNEEEVNVDETDSIFEEQDITKTRNVRDFSSFAIRTSKRSGTANRSKTREEAYNQKSCAKEEDSRLESYDSPSAESPGVFGYSKDDWKKGKTSVTELTGDVELATITFKKDDERQKLGLEPFATFKGKNPI